MPKAKKAKQNQKTEGTPPEIRKWLVEQPFAHRGLHDNISIPENSMAAFKKAVDTGYGVELDVRMSSDGVAMVFHDSMLERMTDVQGSIGDFPSYQLKKIQLLNTQETIPALTDVLEMVDNRAPILIEVKSDIGRRSRTISGVRRALEGYTTKVGVISFDPKIPRWFAIKNGPWVPGLVLSKHAHSFFGRLANTKLGRRWLLKRSQAQFLAKDVRDFPCPFTAAKRRQGYMVLSWTVKDAHDRAIAQQYADNIIFEPHDPR